VRTLVDDVQSCLASMTQHFRDGELIELATLRSKQRALVEILKRAQRSLTPEASTAPSKPNFDFRLRVLQWILALTAVQLCVMLLRLALGIRGPVVPGTILLVVVVGLFVLLSLRPALRSWIALAFTLSSQATIVAASAFWGYDGPPPGLVYLVTIAYHAELIALPFSSVAVACVNVGIVGIAVAQGAANSVGAALFLFGIVACALAMQGFWSQLSAWVGSSLHAAELRERELARSEAFRTRICGTLFHDVANLLQGMSVLLEFDEAEDDDVPTFLRLHARLSKLVTAAAATMTDEGPPVAERLRSVELHEVFGDVAELFSFRLSEKGQTLECSLPERLSVTAQPDLLRDSVLANLVSNAIKFSPAGAAIRLHAERKAGAVEICVRDRGPGIPAELAQRLEQGAKVSSTPGSAGEQGLGLGLTLTREHLLRMGGQLALRVLPEGGSEAIIQLRSAEASQA
jgi:signal transduction histidine kinase